MIPHLEAYYARRDRELRFPPTVRIAEWLNPQWELARVEGRLLGMERLSQGDRFLSITGREGTYVRLDQVSPGLHHVEFDTVASVMGDCACVLLLP